MKVFLATPFRESKDFLIADAVMSRNIGIISKGNFPITPIGMCYIAAVLRENGHEVKIFDGNYGSEKDFFDLLKKFSPDVLLLNVPTPDYDSAVRLTKKVKANDIRVGWLGAHVTSLPEQAAKDGADFVIRGEPEITALDAVENLNDFESVLGLSFVSGRKIVSNPERPLIKNLDTLPVPARDLLDKKRYYVKSFFRKHPYTQVISSRGCYFDCSFCTKRVYFGNTVRFRSVDNVIKELKEIKDIHKIDHINFWDDTFTLNKRRVIEICEQMIREKMDFDWYCLSRINTIDLEMMSIMKRAGCSALIYGIESFDQDVLNDIGKKITFEQISKTVKQTRRAGIKVGGFFMVGNRLDTKENLNENIRLASKIGLDFINVSIATPYPGTEFYDSVRRSLVTNDWSHFDTANPVFNPDAMTLEEVSEMYGKFYNDFYSPSKTISRQVRNFAEKFKL